MSKETTPEKKFYDDQPRRDFPLIGLRFLIVDDVKATRNVLKRILFSLNVEFNDLFAVPSIAEAKEILEKEEIDVVISDLNIKFESGLDLLQFVREQPKLASIPFVIITNDPGEGRVESAKKLGVNSFLLKPLSLDNVSKHVSEAILSAN